NVVPDDEASATKTMHGAKNLDLPAVEVEADETMAEVMADEVSPHEAKTVGEMPVIDEDDPFAGVGAEERAVVVDEGELVGAGVGSGTPDEPAYEEEVPKP